MIDLSNNHSIGVYYVTYKMLILQEHKQKKRLYIETLWL